MVYKWGDTVINIYRDGYSVPMAENAITEVRILPAVGDTGAASILQQGGRGRYRASFKCHVATKAEYDAYLQDHLLATERVFTGGDGEVMPMIIEKISDSSMPIPGLYNFSFGLIEA